MRIQERNAKLKKLKEIQERANKGIQTQEDHLTMVDILMKLVKSVKID
jgi:hypothetical protein